jgi:dTMP kinase
MAKGKLVVIEGTDGSGKGTQAELLQGYFKINHIPFALFDFPQYYKTIFGRWIGRFLKGDFGTIQNNHPYIVMFPYAADRWQAKPDMEHALEEGKIVICNRYTSSAAYQAARLPREEQMKFIDWAYSVEYEAFGIPREDIVIFLYVPHAVSQKLIDQKNNRKYMGNTQKKDIHESNDELMKEVEQVYLRLAKRFPHWVMIDCTEDGAILPKEEIHRKILSVLERKKII